MFLKYRRGATLLEMLVVVGILSLIFILLGMIFVGHGIFFQKENAAVDSALATTRSLNDVLAQAREAVGIVASSTFNGRSYQSNSSQLVLKLYSLDSFGAFKTDFFDYAVYYLDIVHPNKLMKQIFGASVSARPSTTRLLDEYVSSLVFNYNNANVENANQLSIFLTSTKTIGGQNFISSSTVTTILRNKQ